MEHWLKDLQEPTFTAENQALTLVTRWNLDHLPRENRSLAAISVADSGNLGVSFVMPVDDSTESSLSMVYANSDMPPRSFLSSFKTMYYSNPIFVKQGGKEYLGAYMSDESIHLWDTETDTSKIVFTIKSTKNKGMKNLFVINKDTVACGDMPTSSNGKYKVYILNTMGEQWNLTSTIYLKTGTNMALDMGYMKTLDGTSCLLLSCPDDKYVQAVEMVGGKTTWQTGPEQMGELCNPWSICSDKDHTVYVADYGQDKLHVLSTEDGSVLSSINLIESNIVTPFFIRVHDETVYIAHRNITDEDRYQVSKVNVQRL